MIALCRAFSFCALCVFFLISCIPFAGAQCTMGSTTGDNFYVDSRGNVTNVRGEIEGPATICIFYNDLRFDIETFTKTTTGPGPAAQVEPSGTNLLRAGITSKEVEAEQVQLMSDIKVLVSTLDSRFNLHSKLDLSRLTAEYMPSTEHDGLGLRFEKVEQDFNALQPSTADPSVKKNAGVILYWDARFGARLLTSTQAHACQTAATDDSCLRSPAKLAEISEHFKSVQPITCGNHLNLTSKTSVSVKVYDELPTLEAGTEAAPVTTNEFINVTCSSPVSISAGVELSTVPKREFGIVQSPGTVVGSVVNVFGLLNDSTVHPLPIVLTHYRLKEWKQHLWGAHVSAGAAANIQGQSSGDSSAEYLVGGSCVIGRFLFLTGGVHFGTESNIAGGFKVGDIVPSEVTSIQVTKSYEPRFGFAISFTKP